MCARVYVEMCQTTLRHLIRLQIKTYNKSLLTTYLGIGCVVIVIVYLENRKQTEKKVSMTGNNNICINLKNLTEKENHRNILFDLNVKVTSPKNTARKSN